MKKIVYILLAASLTLLISCEKGKDIDTPANEQAIEEVSSALTGNKITFDVEMDFGKETMATLSGLNINWQSGDHIGVATNNDATIRVYEVTPKSGKTGTVTIDEVVGATEYYALFKGSLGDDPGGSHAVAADDFSMITFNTTTKTFSGLNVGNQQVAQGSLSSHLYYSNGYPLSMAGKTSGDRNSLIMKPCLALVKLQIASASVPADYFYKNIQYESSYSINHDHYYSAVRGFNLYQKGGSTIYSSGDYDVQVNNDGSLTTTSVGTQKEYRQISQSGKLAASTDYLMCLIPGGEITSFQIDFLGYKDNEGGLSWDAVYTMRNPIACTVSPGDYFDFGTLNPLGLKKAQLEAADEVADEAAAAYVPAITIDGNMSDWAGIDFSFNDSSKSRCRAWKFKSDSQKVYFYLVLRKNRVDGAKNLYIGFDKDNNNGTGSSYGDITGCEAYIKVIPFTNSGEGTTPVPVRGVDAASVVYASGVGTYNGVVNTWEYDAGEDLGSDSSNIYIEISVDRSYLGLPAAGNSITIGCSYGWGTTDKVSVTME